MVIEPGDKVMWMGMHGVAENVTPHIDFDYPVAVRFEDSAKVYFTIDGRYFKWEKPTLMVVEKARKER